MRLFLAALTITAAAFGADPAAPRSFQVQIYGAGAGKPSMILIPGLSSHGSVWDGVVAHFKDQYEMHVLTLAGFAGVPPIDEPLLETVRKELPAYIRAKKLRQPAIAGHSLGGFLALWVASETRGLTGRIVVVDSVPFLGQLYAPDATAESFKPQADMMKNMMAGMTAEAWTKYQKANPALRMMISNQADIDRATQWGLDSSQKTVIDAMYTLMVTDLREAVKKIETPVLVLGAYKGLPDPAAAMKIYQSQYAAIRDAKLVPFENARHFIMYDDLPKMLQSMDEFLGVKK